MSGTDLLTLVPGLYLAPTGAGALHAVTSAEDRPVERLLRLLLRKRLVSESELLDELTRN